MRVVSLQAGRVRSVSRDGTTERTAIDKAPLEGTVRVTSEGLEGDAVGDERWHGGPDQALLCFCADHYPRFEARLGRPLRPGAFGENVTVTGLTEEDVHLGDVHRFGTVEIQVTAPRSPCATLARHLDDPGIVAAIRAPHRAGWYARVLRPGEARAGDALVRLRAGDAAWTVARAAAAKERRDDLDGARALLRVDALAARWRQELRARLGAEA